MGRDGYMNIINCMKIKKQRDQERKRESEAETHTDRKTLLRG